MVTMEDIEWDKLEDREDLPYFVIHYDPVSLEIIDLVNALSALWGRKGGAGADMGEHLKELDRIREQVHGCARQRMLRDQAESIEEAETFAERMKAQCATCSEERAVHLIGDAVHKEAGITNDLVRCTTCGTEFVNLMPYGWKNRIKWMEYLCTQLTTVRDDGLTWAEKVPDQPGIALLVEQIAMMRATHAEQAREKRAQKLAEKKVAEQLVVMRDTLLLWHLQASGLAGGGGMA